MRQELMHALSIHVGAGVCTGHMRQEQTHALSASMKFEKVPLKHAEHMCQD
jgi:hypothetical protein